MWTKNPDVIVVGAGDCLPLERDRPALQSASVTVPDLGTFQL